MASGTWCMHHMWPACGSTASCCNWPGCSVKISAKGFKVEGWEREREIDIKYVDIYIYIHIILNKGLASIR